VLLIIENNVVDNFVYILI